MRPNPKCGHTVWGTVLTLETGLTMKGSRAETCDAGTHALPETFVHRKNFEVPM